MDLTWDLVGQAVFFAIVLLTIWGIGKIIATMVVTNSYLKKNNSTKEEAVKKKQALAPELYVTVVEMLVGTIILALFIIPGFVDEWNRGIISILFFVFLFIIAFLLVGIQTWSKGIDEKQTDK
jgi:hypothetical protein